MAHFDCLIFSIPFWRRTIRKFVCDGFYNRFDECWEPMFSIRWMNEIKNKITSKFKIQIARFLLTQSQKEYLYHLIN